MKATLWNTSLWSSSGGILYLWKAFRYRQKLWSPFVGALAPVLLGWAKKVQSRGVRRLWIFGTNAGWTLPLNLPGGFSEIVAVEPDPLAFQIFQWRMARENLTSCKFTNLAKSPLTRDPRDLEDWMKSQIKEGDAVLFSNLLGQWSLQFREGQEREQNCFVPYFEALFKRVPCASYHDRLSGKISRRLSAVVSSGFLSAEEWTNQLKSNLSSHYENEDVSEIELCDHGLEKFFRGLRQSSSRIENFHWEISPQLFHWIEWIE